MFIKNEVERYNMKLTAINERISYALSFLPKTLTREIESLCAGRAGGASEIRELAIRVGAVSTVIYKSGRVPLGHTVTEGEAEQILYKLCRGSVYAYKECIASGYIPLDHGVRVGICGLARYEDGEIVGVSRTGSLVFRIPGGGCDFEDKLYAVWRSGIGSGMLIYSPPGVGKTTALRSLVKMIGGGREQRRLAVIDERCEFVGEDLIGSCADVLRGYGKRRGIDIAIRTMSPELLVLDEVGAEDSVAILDAVGCGIPLIATAHSGSIDELYSKPSLEPLIRSGVFKVFVGISRTGGGYSLSVDRR